MPEYSYSCDPEEGGCGYFFTVFQKRSEYKQLKKCPECKKHKLIRDLSEDNISCSVKVSKGAKTIGHLAELNSNRMGKEQKEKLKSGTPETHGGRQRQRRDRRGRQADSLA